MDTTNPAVQKPFRISPKLMLEAVENPEVFRELMRTMSVSTAVDIYNKSRDTTIPFSQRLAMMELLTKLADYIPQRQAASLGSNGPGFSININFPPPNTLPKPATVVIEQVEAPTKVVEAE